MISQPLQAARAYEACQEASIPPQARPAYHLTPRVGWMNDPNGFSYHQGVYHLFYQYHPYSLQWGPMHWGHATSPDLVHWTYQPCALAPDQPYDGGGCFSGSALTLPDGRHLLMYTGVREETGPDGAVQVAQTQCLAVGVDGAYEKWTGNPVLDGKDLPEGGSTVDFRDPKLWQEPDGSYACVVGNRSPDGSGWLLLYRSPDAFHWTFDGILERCRNELGKMWECPDFFWLDGVWVILTSPQEMQPMGLEFSGGNGTLCLLGQYDRATGRFARQGMQAIDYGLDFYAPQTTTAPDGRRLLVGWLRDWATCHIGPPDARWCGQMTIPRELTVRDGRLIQTPVRELADIRGPRIAHRAVVGAEQSFPQVRGRVVDLTVTVHLVAGEVYQWVDLQVAKDGCHTTLIRYQPDTSVLTLDRSRSGMPADVVNRRQCQVRPQGGALKLRLLLDRFSVEVFVNDGEQVLSAALYTPQTAEAISFACQGQAEIAVELYQLEPEAE